MKINGVIAMLKKKVPKIIQINDILQWYDNGELELSPKYQRNSVWNEKAKSYLIDTILRGLPIPPIFMRQAIDVATKKLIEKSLTANNDYVLLRNSLIINFQFQNLTMKNLAECIIKI